MKNLIKQLSSYALIVAMFSSCDPYEQESFYVDKPESVILQEQLNEYNTLESYLNPGLGSGFKLGAALAASDYSKKDVITRLINSNFQEITPTGLTHNALVQVDGSISSGGLVSFMEIAKANGKSIFGPTLVTHTSQDSAYLNGIIAPLIISGDAAKFVIANFDNDNLGTTYPMSPAGATNSATVVVQNITKTGRVLNVKSVRSHPEFNVTLPQGRVLGDYVSLTLDMFITGGTGGFGSGMRIFINGRSGTYNSALSYVSDGVWGKMTLPLATMALTTAEKQLSTFKLAVGSETGAGNYFIDNIALQDINIPKTQQQKVQLIDGALAKWISALVDTSKTYIKSWNVIDQPMDDANPTLLRTGIGKTLAPGEFFWQDYLGKDYGVRAFQLARQFGNADDKLYISDNNLWSNPAKLAGLIAYINYMEGKGAEVDGIGTDLNLSVTSDKASVDQMYMTLAATGKLIKISSLSVGIGAQKVNATVELYQQQSDMYEYVVKKYLELVPSPQRGGITIRNFSDATNGNVDPLGLWTSAPSLSRKPAYLGLINGLKGQ